MTPLIGTLVADGSSDRMLKPILEWLLLQYLPPQVPLDIQVPEWGRLQLARSTLPTKLLAAQHFYPADVYFLHRDAEKEAWDHRANEIARDASRAMRGTSSYIRVIPVRMTEAWLLHNEAAIRLAAENPNGRMPLTLPPLNSLESLSDPKEELFRILREATGLSGRRLQKFREGEHKCPHRLADIQQEDGFLALRKLPAFLKLEAEIQQFTEQLLRSSPNHVN